MFKNFNEILHNLVFTKLRRLLNNHHNLARHRENEFVFSHLNHNYIPTVEK